MIDGNKFLIRRDAFKMADMTSGYAIHMAYANWLHQLISYVQQQWTLIAARCVICNSVRRLPALPPCACDVNVIGSMGTRYSS